MQSLLDWVQGLTFDAIMAFIAIQGMQNMNFNMSF